MILYSKLIYTVARTNIYKRNSNILSSRFK